MKMMNKLTALLLGTAMLGSPLIAFPVTAAEVTVNSVRNYTLDALMQMDEAQINALTDLYLPGSYADAVQETQNFHELELELGKETFFVKLMEKSAADRLFLTAAAPNDGSGAAENPRTLSWAEAESLLGLPVRCMKNVTEGEAKGYLHVTVDLNAYGTENACKTYIMVQAKLRANENIADAYEMSIGGGKRITEVQQGEVTPTEASAPENERETFFKRIAGWQNASLSDCIQLGGDELLTPDKPYQISRVRFTPYCVYMNNGAKPDTDAILAKWKEMLLAAGYPKDAWLWDHCTCDVTEQNGGYQIVVPQDAYAGITLADCLMTFPAVQRIEAQFGYMTDDRPNQPAGYAFRFTKDGTDMPKAEDFPQLSGVQISGDVPLMTQTDSTWSLSLTSGRYEDYFEAAKYLQTLDFVHGLYLCYGSTELADDSEDAKIPDPEPTVLYDCTADSASLTELTRDAFFKCIASREQMLYDTCIRPNENQLLTPNKPYTVQRQMIGPFCVTLRKGGTLDADAVLAKWKDMLKAAGYPADALADFTCKITECSGVYTVRTTQDGYDSVTLADCLKTFPDVQRIGRNYGYRSDDFANGAGNFKIGFRSEGARTAADFPALDTAKITGARGDMIEPDGRQFLTLNSTAYADYFTAIKYMQTLDFVHDLSLGYEMTCMAMIDEPQILDTEMTVLFDRGDLNLDGSADVADAVLLARYLASDTEASVNDQGLANADADGDGRIRDDDLTVLLKRIAKKY